MTCKEFLKALEENPDAELIFEKIIEPDTGNGRLSKQYDNLTLWVSPYTVRVSFDSFK